MPSAECRVPNAAFEKPLRRSPFRSLVWKEWRQQRWIFLSLAGLAYALLLSALIVSRSGFFHGNFKDDAAGVLCGCAAFLGIVGVVVLSANAFSGERDDNTEHFLEMIPCSRDKLFRVKLGFVLFLILLELIPLAAGGLVYIGRQPQVDFNKLVVELGPWFLGVAAGVLVLAIIPALIASFGGSVIATILASVPVCAGCLAYAFWSARLLVVFLVFKSYVGVISAVVLFVVLTYATLLMAARRMWGRAERTWRSSLRTAAATGGLLIAYVVVPAAAAYLYVTFFAPVSFFFTSGTGGTTLAADPVPSPDGKYVTFDTRYSGWGRSGIRVALMDMESSRTRWLTRFRYSLLRPSGERWPPSGNRFVLTEADIWLWPLAREATTVTYSVVEARSGKISSFGELCPAMLPIPSDALWPVGWYRDQVFCFQSGPDILFADIEHHQVQRCKLPITRRTSTFQEWPVATRRGFFAVPEDVSEKGELHILRFTPNLSQAESLLLSGIAPKLQVRMEASGDGQWLLLTPGAPAPHQNLWYLVRPADGAKATLLVSNGAGASGSVAPSWQVKGFVPGGHQILLYDAAELGLFDADSHALRRIRIEFRGESSSDSIMRDSDYLVMLSPRGGFALLPIKRPQLYPYYLAVDLNLGASWPLKMLPCHGGGSAFWLGEDRLLSEQYGKMPLVMNRDGTGERPLLK